MNRDILGGCEKREKEWENYRLVVLGFLACVFSAGSFCLCLFSHPLPYASNSQNVDSGRLGRLLIIKEEDSRRRGACLEKAR